MKKIFKKIEKHLTPKESPNTFFEINPIGVYTFCVFGIMYIILLCSVMFK